MIRVAAIALGLTLGMITGAIPSADAAPAADTAATLAVQPSSHESTAGARGRSNVAGMIVGLVLFGGWSATGTVMFRRARQRRRVKIPASRDADST